MNNEIFILIVNNGEEHEHYKKWNHGLYDSLELAQAGIKESDFPIGCFDIEIEHWRGGKKIKSLCFDLSFSPENGLSIR